jgi:hypothetical protein
MRLAQYLAFHYKKLLGLEFAFFGSVEYFYLSFSSIIFVRTRDLSCKGPVETTVSFVVTLLRSGTPLYHMEGTMFQHV